MTGRDVLADARDGLRRHHHDQDADREVDVERTTASDRWSVKKPPSSGPITVATPKTAPSAPWYFPRSRSGTTSAISAVAVTVEPAAADALDAARR